jgi:hypothetical protein
MTKLAKVEVMLPRSAERKLDELLLFDARCVDAGSRQELLRLLPGLVHIRRAWRAHYTQHGCLACTKPDPTIAIAARLRRRGSSWAEIYEITGAIATTRAERKRFEGAVCWKLVHLDAPTRERSHRYGAGGFCDRCYLRLRRELAGTLRKMHENRNADEETAALTRRFDLAQWLLGGDGN